MLNVVIGKALSFVRAKHSCSAMSYMICKLFWIHSMIFFCWRCPLMPDVPKPFFLLGDWQFGSAPVYVNDVEVGRVSMFGPNRFQFSGPRSLLLGFSALGDTWIEAVAAWFCVAACVPAGILPDLSGGASDV